jgi:hypothetical protein
MDLMKGFLTGLFVALAWLSPLAEQLLTMSPQI